MSGTAKRSNFDEVGLQNVYQILDQSGVLQAGQFYAQGLGYTQNPTTHDYGFEADTEKTVNFHGQHTLSVGWGFGHSIYALTKAYSGGRSIFPSTNIAGISTTTLVSNPGLIGSTFDAAFELKAAPVNSTTGLVDCSPNDCPFLTGSSGVPTQVYLKQNRGLYSPAIAETSSVYHAIYGNDNYSLNRYVTFNVGLRWEEEQLNGTTLGYVFVDNWSPRLGINIDPFGDRKSKVILQLGPLHPIAAAGCRVARSGQRTRHYRRQLEAPGGRS